MQGSRTVSIGQVLLILWRRGWIVALTFLTAISVASVVLLFVPGRYDAIATASIDPGSIDPVTNSSGGGSLAIGLMQGNMLQLVQSQRVALDVVKRLNLTANPAVQNNFRQSGSFGREDIDNWMGESLLKNVDPKFDIGTNVLAIKYKTGDPNQAALIANAFLAATIDGTIAMKAAAGDQTARWFDPQLDEMRKELEAARVALEEYQKKTNLVAPTVSADTESSTLMAISQNLSSNVAALTALQSRLDSGSTELSTDPSDPDLQSLAGLKEKLLTAQSAVEAAKSSLGANNPRMVSEAANIASVKKQITEATERMRQHLKDRIANVKDQIAALEASKRKAQQDLIAAQGQRNKLGELEHDVTFRLEQLNERERMADQARLQSKLTFANIAVLDKATPPIEPAFPKPLIVVPVAIGAGLVLGLILALLAEMTDRRVRSPDDLKFAASAPMLGTLKIGKYSRVSKPRGTAGRWTILYRQMIS
jgi:polysaccharide biosynthesis transport protein